MLANSEGECLIRNIFALTKGRIRYFLRSVTPDWKESVMPERGWPRCKCPGGGAREVDGPASMAGSGYAPPALAEPFHLGTPHPAGAGVPPCQPAAGHLHRWAGAVVVGQGDTRAHQIAFPPTTVQSLTNSVVCNESCHWRRFSLVICSSRCW